MIWYKMYVNSIRDIKFRKLKRNTQGEFSHFWTLWCIILDEASACDGVIDVLEEDWDLMFDLISEQTSSAELGNMINELDAVDLITVKEGGSIIVKNWEKYQVGKDYSTDRVTRHRESVKNTEIITETIHLFNKMTGGRSSDKVKTNRELISGRVSDGHTLEEFSAVIAGRQKAWGNDPKMKKYITISTIFRPSNFDKYLNEIPKDIIDAASDGTLLKVRDMYGTTKSITPAQFDQAAAGFYTKLD